MKKIETKKFIDMAQIVLFFSLIGTMIAAIPFLLILHHVLEFFVMMQYSEVIVMTCIELWAIGLFTLFIVIFVSHILYGDSILEPLNR